MLEQEEWFADDTAVGGDGAVEFAIKVQAAGDADVVDHGGCGGGAAEGVAEHDDVLRVDFERVVHR